MENKKREELIKSILEGARKNPEFRKALTEKAEKWQSEQRQRDGEE